MKLHGEVIMVQRPHSMQLFHNSAQKAKQIYEAELLKKSHVNILTIFGLGFGKVQ